MIRKFLYEMDIKVPELIFCHIKCLIPSIIATASSVIFPSFLGKIVDYAIGNNDLRLVIIYWNNMLICGMVMILFSYWKSILYSGFEQELYCNLKNKVLKKVLQIKDDFKDSILSGDLYKSINDDLENITSYLAVLLPDLFINIVTLISIISIILKYYSIIGLLILILIFMLGFCQPWLGSKIEKNSFICRDKGGDEAAFLQEVINNSEAINMMGYSPVILNKYFEKSRVVKNSNKKLLKLNYLAQNIRLGINTVALLITIIVGTILVFNDKIGVGIVFTMTMYIQRVSAPLNSIVQDYLLTKSYKPFFKRILELCDKAKKDKERKIFPQEELQSINIDHLSYFFPKSLKLYSDFSVEIIKGEVLGIIGDNGTGKSTLIKILMNAISYKEGKIVINKKIELRNLDEQFLHQNISIVPQTSMLLTGKLREVLNPTQKDVADNKIVHLLNLFTVDFGIFNCSLDYEIAEKGMNISGGEAQKLALVRMAIENKPWIILDEPTSSMDNNSEKEICHILREYFIGRTAIIITHRPEILKICNKVIKLEN